MDASKSRVDKLLALTGMSRTEAKKCVSQGRVTQNGAVVRDAGEKAYISELMLDGKPLDAQEEVYLMINKPAGVVTATQDPRFPTVVSLLPKKYQGRKIGPVGRLDRDVTGLVLLTTDGEMAHRLISPKWKAEKTYLAVCEGPLDETHVEAFAKGIELSDFTARSAKLEIIRSGEDRSEANVTLTEGKFHQVKRMFAVLERPLISLKRIRISEVRLDEDLAEGEFRLLTDEEVRSLKKATDLL